MDQPKPLAFKSGLKYRSSNPLENLISLLNSEMQTTSKIRNIVAFSDFISTIEPKNVKQALKDVDWVELMQYKLHQFERSNVWCLFPRPWNRTIYEPGVYSGIILKKMFFIYTIQRMIIYKIFMLMGGKNIYHAPFAMWKAWSKLLVSFLV